MTNLRFRILHKDHDEIQFKEFIKYETLEECINYLEKVNTTLRPAIIVTGQQYLRAYDYGIIDYDYINQLEQENQELRDNLWEVRLRKTDSRKCETWNSK